MVMDTSVPAGACSRGLCTLLRLVKELMEKRKDLEKAYDALITQQKHCMDDAYDTTSRLRNMTLCQLMHAGLQKRTSASSL